MIKADIKALITLTDRDKAFSDYRPAHLIGNYLTTGVHTYIGIDCLQKGQSVEGYITFISPEDYPHSMRPGDIIPFQDGSTPTGYIEVLEIYNKLLEA